MCKRHAIVGYLRLCRFLDSGHHYCIRHISTHCQGAMNCKPTVLWFPILLRMSCFQELHTWRKYVNAWAECHHQQWNYLIIENNDKENNMLECLNLDKIVISQPSWDGRLFGMIKQIWHPSMVSIVNLLLKYCTGQVSFVGFNLSWIVGAQGWGGLFGIIKQIWHPCGVANMIVGMG